MSNDVGVGTIGASPRPFCFLCGAPGCMLYENMEDNLFSAPGYWSIKQCAAGGCGILWLDPMPLESEISRAYQDYYTHDDAGNRSALFQLSKRLYRLLVDGFLTIGGIPAERRRASMMFIGDRSPGLLLDIGCGQGTFLALMAARGWSVKGVDFDATAVETARRLHQLDVRIGTADTLVKAGELFDVVTASHVIEHVSDPIEFLRQCRQLLKPGGSVVLRTPNVASFGHCRYGRNWRGLEPPRHLHLLSESSLRECARRAGFPGIHTFTTSVGAEGILLASHYLEADGAFRPSHLSRMSAIVSKILGPCLALRGKIAWHLDPSSGEEVCAVLTNGTIEK